MTTENNNHPKSKNNNHPKSENNVQKKSIMEGIKQGIHLAAYAIVLWNVGDKANTKIKNHIMDIKWIEWIVTEITTTEKDILNRHLTIEEKAANKKNTIIDYSYIIDTHQDEIKKVSQKIKNLEEKRKSTIGAHITRETLFISLWSNMLKEKQQNLQKDEEILQNFSFLKFADATGKTPYLPKIYKNMIIDNFAMFPKETIERRLKYIITGNTHTNFDTWKIAHAYANADDDVIKFTLDNHSKLTKEWAEKHDTHPNVTINNPEAFPPEDVEIDYKINTNTIYHELSHRIFSHGDNEYWINKYLSKITETGTNDSDFAYNYGKSSITEDMATISELMFSQSGWKTIEDKTQKSEIFQAKIKAMKELFHEVSNGKMNEEYFQKIQNGEIKNGRDAQDFFKKFDEEK